VRSPQGSSRCWRPWRTISGRPSRRTPGLRQGRECIGGLALEAAATVAAGPELVVIAADVGAVEAVLLRVNYSRSSFASRTSRCDLDIGPARVPTAGVPL
jgi:hypothetical protein